MYHCYLPYRKKSQGRLCLMFGNEAIRSLFAAFNTILPYLLTASQLVSISRSPAELSDPLDYPPAIGPPSGVVCPVQAP